MQFRGGETKGYIVHDFLKYSGEEKFIVEAGGRAGLTLKPRCH